MAIGIDMVHVPEFTSRLQAAGGAQKVFLAHELTAGQLPQHLAGMFAAKEAFFKALGRKADWHEVWIEYEPNGKPLLRSTLCSASQRLEVSISHAGDYTVALVVLI